MKGELNIALQGLKETLVQQGYEFITNGKKNKDGTIAVEVNKLQPVEVNHGETIYMPIPETLIIKAGTKSIEIIKGNITPRESILDAENFAKMLVDNNKLEGMQNLNSHGATHLLEINENGQKVIRRKRFNAF